MVAYFNRRSVQVTLVFLVLIAVFSYTVFVTEKNYVLLSFIILTLVLLLFISRFESRRVSSKEMVFFSGANCRCKCQSFTFCRYP